MPNSDCEECASCRQTEGTATICANLAGAPYTKMPNILLDYWLGILSKSAFVIFSAIFRKIYGWGKRSDFISFKQLRTATRLSRNTIRKAVSELVDRYGLLKRTYRKSPEGDDAPTRYEVNEKRLLQGGGSKFAPPEPETASGGGQQLTSGGGSKSDPTKEKEYTKDIPTKENPPLPPRGKAVLFGSHVRLKRDEYEHLCKEQTKVAIDSLIEDMNDWIDSKGKPYKDYAAALRTWIKRRGGSESLSTEKNRLWAEKVKLLNPCAEIEIGYNYLELRSGQSYEKLMFSDGKFLEKALIWLRVRNMSAPDHATPSSV